MTQRQFAEALQGATEFVLNLVDQVGRASGIDRLGHDGIELRYREGEPLPDELESSQPLSFVRTKDPAQNEGESEEGIALLDFGDEDDTLINLDSEDLLEFDLDEEEETIEQEGDALLEFVDEEEKTSPFSLRPTRDEMGENMAREMLLDAVGGSSDDDPMDRNPSPERTGTVRPDLDA